MWQFCRSTVYRNLWAISEKRVSHPLPGVAFFLLVGRALFEGGMPLSAESDRRCCSTCGAPAPSIFSFAKEEQERKRGETICRSTIWRQRWSVVGLAAPPEWPMMQMSSTKSMEYISDSCTVPEMVLRMLMVIVILISPSAGQAVPCLMSREKAGISMESGLPAMPGAKPS